MLDAGPITVNIYCNAVIYDIRKLYLVLSQDRVLGRVIVSFPRNGEILAITN